MADDDLKKLPPEERIKKLKELEKKRKKEIEEGKGKKQVQKDFYSKYKLFPINKKLKVIK